MKRRNFIPMLSGLLISPFAAAGLFSRKRAKGTRNLAEDVESPLTKTLNSDEVAIEIRAYTADGTQYALGAYADRTDAAVTKKLDALAFSVRMAVVHGIVS